MVMMGSNRLPLQLLLDQYHKCVSTEHNPERRDALLDEIGSRVRENPQMIETEIRGLLTNNAWSVSRDKERLLAIVAAAQEAIRVNRIDHVVASKDGGAAIQLLAEIAEEDALTPHRDRLIDMIIECGEEGPLCEILYDKRDLSREDRMRVYQHATAGGMPELAYCILVTDPEISSETKSNLARSVAAGRNWRTLTTLLGNSEVVLSEDVRNDLWDAVVKAVGDDAGSAEELLSSVEIIPDEHAKALRAIAGHLDNKDRYVWLMNHGLCRVGVKKLLRRLEKVSHERVELLPVWSEQADEFVCLDSSRCPVLSMPELPGLVCRFWANRCFSDEYVIEREVIARKDGIPADYTLQFIVAGSKSSEGYYTWLKYKLIVQRIDEDRFRYCLGWKQTINARGSIRQSGSHYSDFAEFFESIAM